MGDAIDADGESSSAILTNDEAWAQSSLGRPSDWPQCLQSFAAFIMTLPHPAAIFWGPDLAIVHNDAWKEVNNGTSGQGKEQASTLSDAAVVALRSASKGHVSHSFPSHFLVEHISEDSRDCPVMLSPLLESHRKPAEGTVAQILLGPGTARQSDGAEGGLVGKDLAGAGAGSPGQGAEGENTSGDTDQKDEDRNDELALDNHPFFKRFAEMLPMGLAILNNKIEALFVNAQFYELTTHHGEAQSFKSWPETIHQDDYDKVMEAYHDAYHSRKDLCIEFRAHGLNDPWRQVLMRPIGDGNLRHAGLKNYGGFVCAIIDITPIKAAEISHKQAAEEAQERKEQQERFVDMISHEIRNPLSAILHCAEDILEAAQHGEADGTSIPIHDIVEAAETITLCVSHQKNIVDDVLSFSKLDSAMLSLAPKSIQPRWHLSETLKMFQPELRKQNIAFDFKVDTSYPENNVDWVMADLVRISQVVVNLVTNAIKFTAKKDGEKKISVGIGASLDRPTSYPPSVVFFDTEEKSVRIDPTRSSEWGNGEAFYILVAITDTGIGISTKDQAKLFERFRQATPKTEEIYGGSGLGLNISRKLCQLHGGDVGVSSREGCGSTFGFFFRVRRSDGPGAEEVDMKEVHKRLETPEQATTGPIDDADVPGSLKDPIIEHIEEANPSISVEDGRYQHTAKIASGVEEKSADKYGVATRDSRSGRSEDSGHSEASSSPSKPESEPDRPEEGRKTSLPERRRALFNVLLVEDNLINQRILCKKLQSKGFNVTTANNGREAVNIVQEPDNLEQGSSVFTCILMDQEMPVMDGNAATRAIRELESQGLPGRVPILGVTANVRDEQKADMRKAGMDDVISKPYKIEDIVALIKKMTAPR